MALFVCWEDLGKLPPASALGHLCSHWGHSGGNSRRYCWTCTNMGRRRLLTHWGELLPRRSAARFRSAGVRALWVSTWALERG
jgi:hypothetical protein